jgi:hypothetical protein
LFARGHEAGHGYIIPRDIQERARNKFWYRDHQLHICGSHVLPRICPVASKKIQRDWILSCCSAETGRQTATGWTAPSVDGNASEIGGERGFLLHLLSVSQGSRPRGRRAAPGSSTTVRTRSESIQGMCTMSGQKSFGQRRVTRPLLQYRMLRKSGDVVLPQIPLLAKIRFGAGSFLSASRRQTIQAQRRAGSGRLLVL